MQTSILQNAANSPLPDLLDDKGFLKLQSAEDYDRIDKVALRLFCHKKARYGLPTKELVEWLRSEIGSRRAIEIGSGSGDLAYHLGIPATDNRMQEWPPIVAYYKLFHQPLITYGSNVETLDCLKAIEQYQPEVVIGQWVTHKYDPDQPWREGNQFGLDENAILATGVTYIMIGNGKTHQHKPIFDKQHEEYALSFLRSRAAQPELDRVWIWRGRT